MRTLFDSQNGKKFRQMMTQRYMLRTIHANPAIKPQFVPIGKNELKVVTKKHVGFISYLDEDELEYDEMRRLEAINVDRQERSFFGIKPQAMIDEEERLRKEAEEEAARESERLKLEAAKRSRLRYNERYDVDSDTDGAQKQLDIPAEDPDNAKQEDDDENSEYGHIAVRTEEGLQPKSLRMSQGKYRVGGNKQFADFKSMYEDQQVVYGPSFDIAKAIIDERVPTDILKLGHINMIAGQEDGKESYMLIPKNKARSVAKPALRSPARGPIRMCRINEEERLPAGKGTMFADFK